MATIVDYEKLYKRLDGVRRQRGISWNKVATRAGVAPTTLSGFVRSFEVEGAKPKALALDNFVSLCAWMGVYDLKKLIKDENDA